MKHYSKLPTVLALTLSLLCGFSLSFIPIMGAQTQTEREINGLNGPVKTIRLKTSEINQINGKPVERMRSLEIVTEYGEHGNKTEESSYYGGVLLAKATYSFDNKGNRITIRYRAEGKMVSKLVESFDAAGKPIGGSEYDADDVLQSQSVYTYDAQGRFLEASIHNADGSLRNKTIFKYDAAGKPIGHEVYDASGKLMLKQLQKDSERTDAVYGEVEADKHQWVTQSSSSSELDSHGNWIKKSTPVLVTRGSTTEETITVTYRDITYY